MKISVKCLLVVERQYSNMSLEVTTVSTTPFDGMKLGTGGLRKKVTVFKQTNYTENFIQSMLTSISPIEENSTLVIGGDGRYYCKEACESIVRVCAANGIGKMIVGKDGIFSTPAMSAVIRKHKLTGGIILTASHNPGGPNGDFGIKFNLTNGGHAPVTVTDKIFEVSKSISEYYTVPRLAFDISKIGVKNFEIKGRQFVVEVVDPVEDYVKMMTHIFDFCALSNLLSGKADNKRFQILIDSLHGVSGPYVKRIFVELLGAPDNNVRNVIPLEDFGGKHPDPNLTYAADLMTAMKEEEFELGAALDGDADRSMILGYKGFFVTPSDSLAVLTDNLEHISYYKSVKGVARSMPTSAAVDRVAAAKNIDLYETPTGWKFFVNLLEDGKITLCGEESFGIGSDHIREKDGIWAILAWLSVISRTHMTVKSILENHWMKYGRNFYTRYDYESCDSEPSERMIQEFDERISSPDYLGMEYSSSSGKTYRVKHADNFSYTDPVDGSVATKQGIRVIFEDGSRFIVRLSGTGSTGHTIRLYIDSYEADPNKYTEDNSVILKDLLEIAINALGIKEFTGRSEPTVIT